MLNYYKIRRLHPMADACEESSDCSDSMSGSNSSFYAESSSSEEDLQYEEHRTSSSSAEKQKLRSEAGIEFVFETVCDTEVCEKDKASFGKQ